MRGGISGATDGTVIIVIFAGGLYAYNSMACHKDNYNLWRGGLCMERNRKETGRVGWILKALLISYVLTGALLLVLAMLLYKLNMDEKAVSAGITAIYITATLIGGLAIGKMAGSRRFIWGLILGILYFALLLLITLGVYRTLDGAVGNILTTFLLCAGGGMIGGMIS